MKKKVLLAVLLWTICSCVFAEVRLGCGVGDKLYIANNPANESEIVFSNFLIVKPKIEVTVFKNLDLLAEFEFGTLVGEDVSCFSGNLVVGFQYGFLLPGDFYIRPGLKFGVCGFMNHNGPTKLFSNGANGFFVEANASLAKRFFFEKNFIEIYTDISWRKEINGYASLSFDIGLSYGFGG